MNTMDNSITTPGEASPAPEGIEAPEEAFDSAEAEAAAKAIAADEALGRLAAEAAAEAEYADLCNEARVAVPSHPDPGSSQKETTG